MTKTDKKSKRRGRRAGTIAFGLTALIYAAIFPLYRLGDFLVCGALSLLVSKIASVMGTPLDLTTHNKLGQPTKAAVPQQLPRSGNEQADAVIDKGQEMLLQIRRENDAIPDAMLSAQMEELERLCIQIFRTVAEKPAKAPVIRKFMNYYLPTTLKMLANYRTMQDRGVSSADMSAARDDLVRGMGMVLTACQKQLDNLYEDNMLDVSTDVEVLEQMLHRDGYTTGQMNAPTAAAAQLREQEAPILPTRKPAKDDFVSFYDRNRGQQS
ncbi:MAG: 5-bromo-4-chloroindolyl phosphate hydrolysis family protein [Clostridia bacterium]|nr:5-bromo-4-chloroindolyl phosphate hydrolysis family protein [Clostridia bacterium]